MQTKRMVTLSQQDGGTLMSVVMAIPVLLLAVFAANTQLQNKMHEMRIMRVQGRMLVLSKQVENAGTSQLSLYQSALKAEPSSRLYRCVVMKDCKANTGSPETFDLYNSSGKVISGFHQLGKELPGSTAKPIRVQTSFEIACGGGTTTCSNPSEIRTDYVIEQYDKNALKGLIVKPLTGEASLARFACESTEYISGVDASGQPICAPALMLANSFQCPKGGSYMVSAKGALVCTPIANYCSTDIAFALVVDRSQSMTKTKKMVGAKDAATEFIDDLKANDQSGIISFSSSARVESNLSTSKKSSKNAIDDLKATGKTNMTAGLAKAEGLLKGASSSMLKVIVLLSDGQHNVGPGPSVKAAELKKDGYRIWTIGFGSNADQTLLRRLATTPADYSFAANPSDLKDRFEELKKAMCR